MPRLLGSHVRPGAWGVALGFAGRLNISKIDSASSVPKSQVPEIVEFFDGTKLAREKFCAEPMRKKMRSDLNR